MKPYELKIHHKLLNGQDMISIMYFPAERLSQAVDKCFEHFQHVHVYGVSHENKIVLNTKKRLEVLMDRREKLIALNRRFGYVRSEKSKKYLRLLLEIRKEQILILKNREL